MVYLMPTVSCEPDILMRPTIMCEPYQYENRWTDASQLDFFYTQDNNASQRSNDTPLRSASQEVFRTGLLLRANGKFENLTAVRAEGTVLPVNVCEPAMYENRDGVASHTPD